MLRSAVLALLLALTTPAVAQETPADPPMTIQRLAELILVIDDEAVARGATFQFTVQDVPIMVVADPLADRMRAMVPIRSAEGLEPEELMRLMQANFDSALDARYAVAQGRLWGVYIHPLRPLEKDQFFSAIAQTVNVALTYGLTYSGGAQTFGGGDSNDIYRELFEELQKRGQET